MFIDYSRPVIELHFFAHMPDFVTARVNKGKGEVGAKEISIFDFRFRFGQKSRLEAS